MTDEQFFEGVASYKLLTKTEVGQNFLIDSTACKRIVDALDIQEGEKVLEIGCGAGSLTYFLKDVAGDADIIDIDEAMLAKVQGDFKNYPNLHIQYGNAAKYDYSSYEKIIGNLPYYITSLIIERALLNGKKAKKMVFMIQKEAADRILAKPKTKDYSPLSIVLSLCYNAKKLFNVGRNSFVPAPHVDSTVIEIIKNEQVSLEEGAKVFRVCNALFAMRRKTIYNNLKNLVHDADKASKILAMQGIRENARPEELTPTQYLNLTKAIEC